MDKAYAFECVVVDDEASVRTTIARMLGMLGCAVTEYESLESLSELPNTLDLILLDLSLRDGDAVEALRLLKAYNYKGAVALMSGHDSRTLELVRKIGVDFGLHMTDCLGKPLRMAELKRLLESLGDGAFSVAAMASPAANSSASRRSSRMFQSALAHGNLEFWYQPKVALANGSVAGFESLVRLRHPKRGVLTPDQFLPRPGDLLHVGLAQLVVERAILDQRILAAVGMPTSISVNVPLVALRSEQFISFLRAATKFGGALNMTAEVTEDEALSDVRQAYESALQLRLLGVDLSIDDFGIGYSSLARMCDLPFSELKIDRRFVSGCAADHLKRGICQTVIDLAHRFEAKVVAEGVEDRDDLMTLAQIGCDYAQGYLLGKPMPLDKLLSAHAEVGLTPPGLSDELMNLRSPNSASIELFERLPIFGISA